MQLFKKSTIFVGAWWHRCAHLPRESITFSSLFHVYNVLDTLFWHRKRRFSADTQVQPRPKRLAKPCKTLGTLLIFQKRWSFRSSVVTLMCAPLARNWYYFLTFSNVSAIWHTLLVNIMHGLKGRHRMSKILKMIRWSLMMIEIIRVIVDIGCPMGYGLVVSGRRWHPWQAYPYSCKVFNWLHAQHIDGGTWGNGITYDMGERVRKHIKTEGNSVTYDMGGRVGL